MRRISLKEFVDEQGLASAARQLGVTSPAIHKALAAGRNIIVSVLPGGELKEAKEVKPFPSQPSRAS